MSQKGSHTKALFATFTVLASALTGQKQWKVKRLEPQHKSRRGRQTATSCPRRSSRPHAAEARPPGLRRSVLDETAQSANLIKSGPLNTDIKDILRAEMGSTHTPFLLNSKV